MAVRRRARHAPLAQPGDRRGASRFAAGDHRRSRPRARRRGTRFRRVARGRARSTRRDPQQGRGADPRARRPYRARRDDGAGQAARRGEGRSARERGADRVPRRRGPARLWPRADAPAGDAQHGAAPAGRPGRGVLRVEFPGAQRRAQGRAGDRRGLLDHPQAERGNPGQRGRGDALFPGRGPARQRRADWCSACPTWSRATCSPRRSRAS